MIISLLDFFSILETKGFIINSTEGHSNDYCMVTAGLDAALKYQSQTRTCAINNNSNSAPFLFQAYYQHYLISSYSLPG